CGEIAEYARYLATGGQAVETVVMRGEFLRALTELLLRLLAGIFELVACLLARSLNRLIAISAASLCRSRSIFLISPAMSLMSRRYAHTRSVLFWSLTFE